jgi:acyl-CoA reductase-like NAD-dependent aldehyde dehydrogenase
VDTLETKRKVKSAAYHDAKKKTAEQRKQAVQKVAAELKPINDELAKYGY